MKKCEMIDDPKEREKCKAEVKAKYAELKEDCYETEPDCEEKAEIKFKEAQKKCENIKDPEEREKCFEQAKITFTKDLEQCECHEEAKAWYEDAME
jgi:hypothetical protein